MSDARRTRFAHYGIAISAVAVAALVRFAFQSVFEQKLEFASFIVAILFCGWYTGVGPSLVALVLGLATATAFFVSQGGDLASQGMEYGLKSGAYSVIGLTSILLLGSLRAVNRRAEAYAERSLRKQKELEREIVERRQVEVALRAEIAQRQRLEDEVQRQADQLKKLDRRKDEFLALLAHELRNPLAPIQSAMEIASLPGTDADRQQWTISVVKRQVQHLKRLVDDLLDVCRINEDKIRLKKETFDLAAAATGAIETSLPAIRERQHQLTVSLPDKPVYLLADPDRLEQILVNVLNNAARYTPPGGRIWFTVQHAGTDIQLRVKDTGIGIRKEMLEDIFEPFVQVEQGGHSQGGLGLGLALVKQLVQLHGGTVSASSAGPGQGSEFVIRLPAGSPPLEIEHSPEVNDGEVSQVAPPCRRILMVDDNTDSAECLAVLLRSEGYEVFVASDGFTALEAAPDFLPDIVISDIGMPRMDGYELVRRLKGLPDMEHVRLVALTGWNEETDQYANHSGFDQRLAKPVEFEALKTLLAQV